MTVVTSVMTYGKRMTGSSRRIVHKQVQVDKRGHFVDVHVLPACQLLWDAGIDTFYSCQGGPTYVNPDGSLYHTKAYIQILKRDSERTCEILADRNPTIFVHPSGVHKDRCSIDFDPSIEALTIPIVTR